MRTAVRVAFLAAVAVLGGCRSVGVARVAAEDAQGIRQDVANRTGLEIPAPSAAGQACADGADPSVALLARPLTEAAAVKVALLRNATVRASYEALGVARADLLQAGLLSNPVFSVDARSFSAGPEIELGIAQSFVDLFFAPLRRSVAAADLGAAQAAVARDVVRTVFDVRRAFVVARAAQDLVATREAAKRSADASVDLVRTLHDAGNVVGSRLTVEEVGAARAALDLDAARAAAADAREPLNVLLGTSRDADRWTIAGPLPDLPPATGVDAESRAIASSLDLVESRARLEAALRKAGLVRDEGAWSRFDLGAVGKRESDGSFGAGPSLSTSLPVFDWGQARSAAACAVARQSAARHEALEVEIRSAARRLLHRATALRRRVESLRGTYLPLRSRLVLETLQSYNAMQIGAFEVLDAKQAEVDAQREASETLRDAWLARLDLEELLAGSWNAARLEAAAAPAPAEPASGSKGH